MKPWAQRSVPGRAPAQAPMNPPRRDCNRAPQLSERVADFSPAATASSAGVPPAVPADLFLSGDWAEEEASVYLFRHQLRPAAGAPGNLGYLLRRGPAAIHASASGRATTGRRVQAALCPAPGQAPLPRRVYMCRASEPTDDAGSVFVRTNSLTGGPRLRNAIQLRRFSFRIRWNRRQGPSARMASSSSIAGAIVSRQCQSFLHVVPACCKGQALATASRRDRHPLIKTLAGTGAAIWCRSRLGGSQMKPGGRAGGRAGQQLAGGR